VPLLEPVSAPVPVEREVSGVVVEEPVDGDDPVDGVVSCIRVPVPVVPVLITSMRLTCSVSPEPE
jgi:hypothetical protein